MKIPLCFLLPIIIIIINDIGEVRVVYAVDQYHRSDFPADMVFGAGTSAYQVEGAAFEDGRTASIFDTFAHSGRYNGSTGDIASDEYHKYKEDIHLMVDTGLEAYRFSISWSRLIPNGRGSVNPKGLEYYNNVINSLISHGIQPHVTLFHDDLPQVLEDEYQGWLSKNAVRDFVAYADVCFREFGHRVSHWTTFNEANVFTLGGYDAPVSPPGRCSPEFGNCTGGNSATEPYIVAHNLLLAHAKVARVYREKYKATQHGFVGINIFTSWLEPCTNTTEDVVATQRALNFYLGWFMNPLVHGDYPETMKESAGNRLPRFTKTESEGVKGSFDFVGINYYSTACVKDDPSSLKMNATHAEGDVAAKVIPLGGDAPYLPMKNLSADDPVGLQKLLDYFKDNYGDPPIYVHENGKSTTKGMLNDTSRVEYLQGYIGSLLDATRKGSNVKGYFVWSFIDVFELFTGYRACYGLYHVDLDDKDLRRYPKLSAHWYRSFLKGTKFSMDGIVLKAKRKVSSLQFHSSE